MDTADTIWEERQANPAPWEAASAWADDVVHGASAVVHGESDKVHGERHKTTLNTLFRERAERLSKALWDRLDRDIWGKPADSPPPTRTLGQRSPMSPFVYRILPDP